MSAKKAFAAAEGHRPETPTPLVRHIPDPIPMPHDALGPLQGAVEAIHEKTQAPFEIAAQSVLAATCLAGQAHRNVETLGGERPISLFLITVAVSGERKSACDTLAMKAVTEFVRELSAEDRTERETFENETALFDMARADIIKKAKGDRDSARVDLAALGAQPQPPLSPWLLADEPTLEGLTKNLEHGRPSIGLFSDEGGQFLGGHAMNSDNRLKTVAGLSKFWDGAPINRTRAGDGAKTYYGRRLAVHLMVQPGAADTLLADPVARDQGIMSRCLITRPTSTIGARLIGKRVAMSQLSQGRLSEFHTRISDLLRLPMPLAENTRNELTPPCLTLAGTPEQLLVDFADAVEREQRAGGRLEYITGFASKAAEHAVRLAGVLTIYAHPESMEISLANMQSGIALADWYLSEAVRLRDSAATSLETTQAEALRCWLISVWPEPFVSIRAIVNRGPNCIRETRLVRKLVPILEANGWLARMPEGVEVLGEKSRETWQVVRG